MPSLYSQKGIHFVVPDGWTVAEDDLDEVVRGITLDTSSYGSCMVDLYRAEQVPPLDEYVQNQMKHFAEALPFGFRIVEGPQCSVGKARHQGREILGTTVKFVTRSLLLQRERHIDSFFSLELGSHAAVCSLRCTEDEVSLLRPAFEVFLESFNAQAR